MRTTPTLGPRAVPILLALVAAAMAAPSAWPLTALGTASYDAIDSHIFLWGFWWTKTAIEELRSPYWTELLLHPTGASLAFHSFPLPYNLIALPWQYLVPGTAGLVVAFNLIVATSFVGSALAAYALAVGLTRHRWCGFVAGVAFAGMPFRSLNVARLHVLSTEFLALFVLAWVSFAAAPTRTGAVLAGLSLTAVYYSSLEYALYAAAFAGLWLVWHLAVRSELRSMRFLRLVVVAVLACVLAAGPLLVVQLRAYARGDVQPALSFDEVKFYSPAMASFVTPSRVQPVYGRWFAFAGEYGDPGTTGMRSETTLGLTFCLLALVGFWRMRRDGTLFWGSAAVLFLVLTLGPYLRLTGTVTTTIPLPYLALYELAPPLRAARDPTRALPMAVLMLTVVAAFGLRAWLARMRTKRSALALTMAISGAMVFESVTGWPAKTPAAELIPPPYRRLSGAGTAGAVMDLTGDHQAMLAQTFHGLPITAGALAVPRAAASRKMLNAEVDLRDPTQLFALDPATRARYISADREMIGRLGIRFVVAPPATASIGLLAEALGLRPIEKGAVEVYIATARGGTPDGQ